LSQLTSAKGAINRTAGALTVIVIVIVFVFAAGKLTAAMQLLTQP
jgi:Sec-independent protein translocase protein TatA